MNDKIQWQSRGGFILATIGAAVGIGNIWRFSYVAGENGGGAFLIIYLACVVLLGLPLLIAELALGRRSQGDAVDAFRNGSEAKGLRQFGWICVGGATLILSYYAVIAGWALKYFAGALTGSLWHSAESGFGDFFNTFIADGGEPVVWQGAMLAGAAVVVVGGVSEGIERTNRWLMPVLAALLVLLAIHALTLPDAGKGLEFLFSPDWKVFSEPAIYVSAIGQAFFSIGLGMAIFVTYGSYLPRGFPIASSASATVFGDSLFAIVAGIAIFPAVFAFGVDPKAGPELAFITLPQIFLEMPAGKIAGVGFFLLLSAAALTSMVALLEVPVATIARKAGLSRRTATAIVALATFVLGIPSAMSFGLLSETRILGAPILDAVDAFSSNILLPSGGILIAIVVGWRIQKADALRTVDLLGNPIGTIWIWLLRYIVPLGIAIILIHTAIT